MKDFRKAIAREIIIFDGAMGTMLQARGLKPGTPPEEALLNNYKMVVSIHREYAKAGAEVLTTNSFGLNPIKIREYGYENLFDKLNRLAVKAVREASDGKCFIAGDIGPTGLFVEPVGELKFKDAVQAFSKQAKIFEEEDVDLFILETFSDIKELKSAVIGVREVSDKPIVALMTFDEKGRSTLGTPPEVTAVVLDALPVDVIGSNCSVGSKAIAQFIKTMSKYTDKPLIAQPNAGVPRLEGGKTVFPETPAELASSVKTFIEYGCRAVGSCCGSTPKHTLAIKKAVEKIGKKTRMKSGPLEGVTALASRTKVVLIGLGQPCVMIGERINPTGKKAFAEELKRGDLSRVREEARAQEANGAQILDVNVGVPGIDEPSMLAQAVLSVNQASTLPIAIDSSNEKAIESALMACDGKPLINSVNGDKKKLDSLLPLARKYGASVLGLCTDEKGVPQTVSERIKIARRILAHAKKHAIAKRQVLLDPVTVPASAQAGQARASIEAVRYFTKKMKRGVIQGVSNVSFGLPGRPALNSALMVMAMEAGLSGTFINVLDDKALEIFFASRVLLDQDPNAKEYINFHAKKSAQSGEQPAPKSTPATTKTELTWKEKVALAVINGDEVIVESGVKEALEKGVEPLTIANECLTPAIQEVGAKYESGEFFLPQLLMSAQAMEKGMALVSKALEQRAQKKSPLGVVVLATVEGDIHDIGKNIVATILRTHGFEVADLGKSVPADTILAEAKKKKADIVGVSALMTTTVVKMPEVIEKAHAIGIPVMVGGAVLTREYADSIHADFYGKDAMSAVKGALELLNARGPKK